MPKKNKRSDELVGEIRQHQKDLAETEEAHGKIRAPIILGPMDDITPWTETGTKIGSLKKKIEEKTFELGQEVLRERGR